MRTMILAALICFATATAFAQTPSCKAQASQKNLAGAAQKSFMTKCESDAKKACEAHSKAKKLAGAAKTSHLKKCVDDAVGS
jgi:hypothetical protein